MIKKMASIMMTLVTLLMMTMSAFAAETGTISIKNAVSGKEYKIYRIFDLESYNTSENAYSYKINEVWGNWAKTQTNHVTVDELGYVHWLEGAEASEFAKAALAYAKENSIEPQGTKTATSSELTFSNLELGYYLVDSSVGALCSLDTTNPNVEMKEKNAEPTVEKEVEEDSTGAYGETNDADIDQVVNFRTTITVQAGGENYVLHDKMSDGLTFGTISSVKVEGNEVEASNYTVTENTTDGCTFEIQFDDTYIGSLEAGKEIVVAYTANLNENAVIAGEGNPNETWLSYGDANNTVHDYTRTFTWSAKVYKFAEKENVKSALAGASFKLSKTEDGSNPFTFSKVEGKMEYLVDVNGTVTEIETDSTGTFELKGLDEGIYYLIETKAPDGYNKLHSPIMITITSAESGKENNKTRSFELKVRDRSGEDVAVSVVEIENKTSVELPKTGDIGTTRFYILGSLMFLSAATLLVVKKKMYAEK